MKKPKGQKAVSYLLIDRITESGEQMYNLLDALVAEHHGDLTGARFALAWNTSWQPDVDGRVTLGKCKKASDLDRELAAYDFVIILREEFWKHPRVSDTQRTALLDHELMHAAVSYDERGETKFDERGRTVYRIRKHDIEEFGDIVQRYGCYKSDIEAFARQLRIGRRQADDMFAVEDARDALLAGGLASISVNGEETARFTDADQAAARERIAERKH